MGAFSRRDFLDRSLRLSAWTLAGASGLLIPVAVAARRKRGRLPPGKSIYSMKGEVRVDGVRADLDTFITPPSLIETGRKSEIKFAVGSDAHYLHENSSMQLRGTGMVEELMLLSSGRALSVFGKREGEDKLVVETSTATVDVRGTGLYTESEPELSYICTCYGLVEIVSKTDPDSAETLETTRHDAPRNILADGTPGGLITPAPFKNHTDLELSLLEAIVGRTTPYPVTYDDDDIDPCEYGC